MIVTRRMKLAGHAARRELKRKFLHSLVRKSEGRDPFKFLDVEGKIIFKRS
jgi:hypothetical protein